MENPGQRRPGHVRGLLPAPACDLLDRFTGSLGVAFTMTDVHGTVVASTGGLLAGQVNHRAASLLRSGAEKEVVTSSHPDEGGTGVCVPVRLAGRVAGALIAHGPHDQVETIARMAAIAAGLALDFAGAAASLGRESINPGWLLHQLLRGSRGEAQHARVLASICGWNLFVQRVALVIVPFNPGGHRDADGRREATVSALQRALGPAAQTPFGQIDETQWVVLVEHEPMTPWAEIRRAAERVHTALATAGVDADVGIGEPHLPVSPVPALRRSYREALYAARLGPRINGGAGIYELRMLGPAAFFAPSSPSRRNLADLVLTPLRKHPAALETLRTYLACNMSVADTATHLQLHRHTVRNHLERVFDLTGLDPRSLEGAVQLKLALLVAASDPHVAED